MTRKDRITLVGLVYLSLILGGGAGGCNSLHNSPVPDSLPAVGNGVERAGAHVESAERLNKAAKPLAGEKAWPLLNQQSEEHTAALDALNDTRKSLVESEAQRQQLVDENGKQALIINTIQHGWGYRLQTWVTRIFWALLAAGLLHIILGGAALFVPGAGGAILAKIGVLLNPAAWFQSLRDNYHFRVQAKR